MPTTEHDRSQAHTSMREWDDSHLPFVKYYYYSYFDESRSIEVYFGLPLTQWKHVRCSNETILISDSISIHLCYVNVILFFSFAAVFAMKWSFLFTHKPVKAEHRVTLWARWRSRLLVYRNLVTTRFEPSQKMNVLGAFAVCKCASQTIIKSTITVPPPAPWSRSLNKSVKFHPVANQCYRISDRTGIRITNPCGLHSVSVSILRPFWGSFWRSG